MRFDKKDKTPRGLVFTQKHMFVYESCTLVTSIGESAPSHKGRWIWYTGAGFNGRVNAFTRVDSACPVADQ